MRRIAGLSRQAVLVSAAFVLHRDLLRPTATYYIGTIAKSLGRRTDGKTAKTARLSARLRSVALCLQQPAEPRP
jgi:hypothetical protein